MYFDQALIVAGVAGAVLFVLSVAYLIMSHRTSRLFRRMLKEETEQLTTFSTTILSTRTELNTENGEGLDMTVADMPQGYEVTLADEGGIQHIAMPGLQPLEGKLTNALDGQYTLLGKLGAGGQGSIFWAKKNNTGNHWIVKHIPWSTSKLTNEADILGKFNHPGLPTIIDIFQDDKGLYLVENYIEGKDMEQVLLDTGRINAFVLLDWADQLSQVLYHLHTMQPEPIYHMDLKPANIMVSPYGNKLTLIDFGISKSQADIDTTKGGTPAYAAPEQLQRMNSRRNKETIEKAIQRRFGKLPEMSQIWGLDARTDIYSLGMILFEAAVGIRPTHENMDVLKEHLSKDFCNIIYKCLAVDPKNRYQNVEALQADINKQKNQKVKINNSLIMRRAAQVAAGFALALSVTGFSYGGHLGRLQAQASMYINPGAITVSLMRSSEIQVFRALPGQEERLLDINNIRWNTGPNVIAHIDGNRVTGVNPGEVLITGYYRDNSVSLLVNVIPHNPYLVDVSQRFRGGSYVIPYAGTVYRAFTDGALAVAEFTAIDSMDSTADGIIYFADSGRLRRLAGGEVVSLNTPHHITPRTVRTGSTGVYILSHEWLDDDNRGQFGIFRFANGEMIKLYPGTSDTVVHDFAIANNRVYFIEYNRHTNQNQLSSFDTDNPRDVQRLVEVPEGIRALAVGGGNIFLADSLNGTLLYWNGEEILSLAGDAENLGITDGSNPNFFSPHRIRYNSGSLYVWDFNVLRRVILQDGAVLDSLSVAGAATPGRPNLGDIFNSTTPARNFVFPHTYLVDFIFDNEGILISEPYSGAIWRVMEGVDSGE